MGRGMVALGTLAAALLHGPALAGLGIAAAFVTPVLVSSDKPDFWALYIYLAIVTAAAFGLARIRLWRWLAVTTIAFALLWTFPCLQCGSSMVAPHAFHVMSGFVLAALLVVCGFMLGPPADEGQIEPISSGSLAAYLLGATMIVLASFHADAAVTLFAILVAGTLLVAWRAQAATAAIAAAAILVFALFAEWAVRGSPDILPLRRAGRAGAGVDLRGGKRRADDRAGADVDGHGMDFDAAADPVPALAGRHSCRPRGAAHRLRATHRRRCGRHHADFQLAAVGLRHSGVVVLGGQRVPAPTRRRRAATNGGIGGDPVHGAAGVHGNPPCRERRRHPPTPYH